MSILIILVFIVSLTIIVKLYSKNQRISNALHIEKLTTKVYLANPEVIFHIDQDFSITKIDTFQENFPLFISNPNFSNHLSEIVAEETYICIKSTIKKNIEATEIVEFEITNTALNLGNFKIQLLKVNENDIILTFKKPFLCVDKKLINGINLIIFNHLIDSVVCIDRQNNILFWNIQAEKYFGWDHDEVVGIKKIDLILKGEYLHFLNREKANYLTSKNEFKLNSIKEAIGVNKLNEEFPIELSTLPFTTDDNTEVFCLIIRNISEHQAIKKSLINKQEFLNAIINTTPACVKIVDSNGKLISMNNIGLEMIESENAELVIGKSVYSLIAPEYIEQYKLLNERVCSGIPQHLIFEIIGLKGGRKWMETRAVPLKHTNGQIVQLALTDDITERVRVENELNKSEALKHTILSSISDAFFALDLNWNLIYINKQAEVLFNRSYKELIGKNFWDEYPELNISHFYKKYLNAIRNEEQIEFEYFYPTTKNWLRVKIYPSKEGFSIFNQDITKEKTEQTILDLERSMLLENNKGTKTLSQIFYNSARVIESIIPNTYCSIHRISENGKSLVNFCTPSISKEIVDKINTLDVDKQNCLFTAVLKSKKQILLENLKEQNEYPFLKEIFENSTLISCISFPLLDSQSEILGVLTIYFDKQITESIPEIAILKKIKNIYREILEERKIADELTKLSLIAKNTNKAVFITNLNHEITWVNHAFTDMSGYSFDESMGKNPIELLNGPTCDEQNIRFIEEQMNQNLPFSLNTIFHKKNAASYWSRITGQPLFDEVGEISQYFAILEDTTIRKLAKLDLQDSEKRYRALFHSNPQPMFIYDKTTLKFKEVNESAEKTYGFSPDEFNEMTMLDLFVENDKDLFIANDDKINYRNNILLNSEIKYETYSHYTKNQKIINIEMVRNEILISGKETILVIINDVTNKLIIEKELRRSNERFSIASKAVSDIIWEWDIRKNNLYWGDGIKEAFGYIDNKPTADTFGEYIHPDDYHHVKNEYEIILKTPSETYWSAEYRFKKANGEYANVIDRAYIIRTSKGEAIKVIGAMRDITSQKNYELEKSKLIGQTQEFERKRFSMELHDGLAQHLVVLNLYLSQFNENEPVDADLLKNCFSLVKTSLNQTRSMCYNLTPPELEQGLLNALKAMFDRLKTLNNINFVFDSSQDITNEDFHSVDNYNLYRIIQEFVNNSIKHSQGTSIECHISKVKSYLLIEVFDNGIGFDSDLITNGLGLNNIEKRAKLANVTIDMSSKVGFGTKLVIRV
ncbi:MAG: PAS domain S-box protein [Flavobacteriia bacterium]|nr:PAS domain S-box protein [Flavobacteriia bacterium]